MNIDVSSIGYFSTVASVLSLIILAFSRQEGIGAILKHLMSIVTAVAVLLFAGAGWMVMTDSSYLGVRPSNSNMIGGLLFVGLALTMLISMIRDKEQLKSFHWAASFFSLIIGFTAAYVGYLLFLSPGLINQNLVAANMLAMICIMVAGLCFFVALLK